MFLLPQEETLQSNIRINTPLMNTNKEKKKLLFERRIFKQWLRESLFVICYFHIINLFFFFNKLVHILLPFHHFFS